MPNNRTIRIVRRCPLCGKHHEMTFDKEKLDAGLRARERGACIQDAFPDFTPSQREFLLSGTCDDCWENLR